MYTPAAFALDTDAALAALRGAPRLALLVSTGADGAPEATHLPLLLGADEGPLGSLHGHLARANPHWRGLAAAGVALAVFPGPEAYVSPGWYPSKAEHGRVVPTWNYLAVHVRGAVEVYDDPARLRAVVGRLTGAHEAGRAAPWAVEDAPAPFVEGQLRGIVGFVLRITGVVGKTKLSQNRAAADRAGVAAGLAASADPADRAVAAAMTGTDPAAS